MVGARASRTSDFAAGPTLSNADLMKDAMPRTHLFAVPLERAGKHTSVSATPVRCAGCAALWSELFGLTHCVQSPCAVKSRTYGAMGSRFSLSSASGARVPPGADLDFRCLDSGRVRFVSKLRLADPCGPTAGVGARTNPTRGSGFGASLTRWPGGPSRGGARDDRECLREMLGLGGACMTIRSALRPIPRVRGPVRPESGTGRL